MGGDSSGNLKRNGVNLGKCAIGARKNEMKTDSLNLPGYPEASQNATFVTGQATQVFRALGEKLRQRKWEAEHPGTKFAGRNSRKRIRERRGFGTGIIRSRRERAGGLALSLRHAERTFQDEAVSRNGGAIQREGCRLRQGERYAARASPERNGRDMSGNFKEGWKRIQVQTAFRLYANASGQARRELCPPGDEDDSFRPLGGRRTGKRDAPRTRSPVRHNAPSNDRERKRASPRAGLAASFG